VKYASLLLFLLFASGLQSTGQRIGSCPPNPPRSPQNIQELKGVFVDENSTVIPRVKVILQVAQDKNFRDIGTTESSPTGQFSFQDQPPGDYRFRTSGLPGFCQVTIPVRYSTEGFKGIRLTLPVAASDSCPQYCDRKVNVEEMTGLEGRE
jgi:hypothetical protein